MNNETRLFFSKIRCLFAVLLCERIEGERGKYIEEIVLKLWNETNKRHDRFSSFLRSCAIFDVSGVS